MVFHSIVWYLEEEDSVDLVSVDIIHLRGIEEQQEDSSQEGFSFNLMYKYRLVYNIFV